MYMYYVFVYAQFSDVVFAILSTINKLRMLMFMTGSIMGTHVFLREKDICIDVIRQ